MATLRKFYEGIRDEIEDLTSLDVVTLTGTIQIQGTTDGTIDLTETYKTIQTKATTTTDVSVVAFTHVALDGDTVQFVKEGLSEGEKPLVDAHVAMMDSSQKARLALFRSVKDILNI